MKDRPGNERLGVRTTTPFTAAMVGLLGSPLSYKGFALSTTEYKNLNKLYGMKKEQPNKRPPPPVAPKKKDFSNSYLYENALSKYKISLQAWENWEDPVKLFQAGANAGMIDQASADGMRLVAWIAKFTEPGQDPLKVLIQLASEAGLDVEPADNDYANDEEVEGT